MFDEDDHGNKTVALFGRFIFLSLKLGDVGVFLYFAADSLQRFSCFVLNILIDRRYLNF